MTKHSLSFENVCDIFIPCEQNATFLRTRELSMGFRTATIIGTSIISFSANNGTAWNMNEEINARIFQEMDFKFFFS